MTETKLVASGSKSPLVRLRNSQWTIAKAGACNTNVRHFPEDREQDTTNDKNDFVEHEGTVGESQERAISYGAMDE